ncbi:MAG: hypothetical protein ABIV63_19085, partial [Caldimonas sp.]
VAGSVAEALVAPFDDPRIDRAYVNNGGDIALHLGPGAAFVVGWVVDPDAPPMRMAQRRSSARGWIADPPWVDRVGADRPRLDGHFRIDAASGIRGIATSGWRGRSFSLGIADSVTVLATRASIADAAATVIANAVYADDPRIERVAASALRDDSDLGDRLVTRDVPRLPKPVVADALDAGARAAAAEIAEGRVRGAALALQGEVRICLDPALVHRGVDAPSTSGKARLAGRGLFDTLAHARVEDVARFDVAVRRGAARPAASSSTRT